MASTLDTSCAWRRDMPPPLSSPRGGPSVSRAAEQTKCISSFPLLSSASEPIDKKPKTRVHGVFHLLSHGDTTLPWARTYATVWDDLSPI